MTAILNEIRRLDELLARGDVTDAEYAAKRHALLQSVEVAETDFEPGSTRTPSQVRSKSTLHGSNAFGLSLVICLGVMALSVGFILLFLPDLNLALTVGVTVLAALTVALLRDMED